MLEAPCPPPKFSDLSDLSNSEEEEEEEQYTGPLTHASTCGMHYTASTHRKGKVMVSNEYDEDDDGCDYDNYDDVGGDIRWDNLEDEE